MLHPSIVDGRSLVILQYRKQLIVSGFLVAAFGHLEYDGESLYFVTKEATRIVTDDELAGFQLVRPDSKIEDCQGFDFFCSQNHAANNLMHGTGEVERN